MWFKVSLLVFSVLALSSQAFAYTFDKEVPENVKNQIIQDMAFIGSLEGTSATPFHRQVFGPVRGSDYVNFFETRVTAVGMDDCGSAKAVACVIPFYDSSRIWLTQNYVKFSHPQVAKMMIVFHEARHTEVNNDNWMHATCPRPFKGPDGKDMRSIWTGSSLAGEAACDITPFGSYGSSTIMLKNIQKFCSNCTEKVKMDAGLYADDQINRITNREAKTAMIKDMYDGI